MNNKLILYPFILILFFCSVFATIIVLPSVVKDYNRTLATNWTAIYSVNPENLLDGNMSTYSRAWNLSVFLINYTKYNDTDDTSTIQIKYNSSGTSVTSNLSLASCYYKYNDREVIKLEQNFTQNYTSFVENETIRWINGTAVSLSHTRVPNSTVIVFNQSFKTTTNNETFIWLVGTNATLAYTQSVSVFSLFNCSSKAVIKSGNYTLFESLGIVQFNYNNSLIPINGSTYCINYSHFKNTTENPIEITAGNYSVNYATGAITLFTNYMNNSNVGVNYSYYYDGTQTIKAYCYNSSAWVNILSVSGSDEVYDLRLYYHVVSRSLNFSYSYRTPDQYSIQTTSSVSVSYTVLDTYADSNHTKFNCSLITKNTALGNYGFNISDRIVSNGTLRNETLTAQDGERIWWYMYCEDDYDREILNSTVRVLDVDIGYNILYLGALEYIYFVLDTGLASFKQLMIAPNITIPTCDYDNCGLVYFDNTSTFKHYGCNCSHWVGFY